MLSKDVTVINGMVRTKDSIKMKDKIVNYRGQMIDVGAGSMGDWSSICSIPGNPTNPIGAWGKTEQEAIENIKPKIDKVLSNKTKDQDNEKIEGYGVKGNNNDKWRRIFSNRAEMMKWVESNNAEIQGTRKAEPNERVGNVDKKTKDEGKYKIYWINHNYYSQEEFNTLEEARKYADSKSFEYRIDLNGKPVASGGALRGFRMMDKKTKDDMAVGNIKEIDYKGYQIQLRRYENYVGWKILKDGSLISNGQNFYSENRAVEEAKKDIDKLTKDKKTKDAENGYVAFYKGKRMDVYANTSYEAQQKAAKAFGAKKSYEVTVALAEKNGEQVVHKAVDKKTKDEKFVMEYKGVKIYEEEHPTFGRVYFFYTSAGQKNQYASVKKAQEQIDYEKM